MLLWADFLRHRIKPQLEEQDFGSALVKALDPAKSVDAKSLPGWSAVDGRGNRTAHQLIRPVARLAQLSNYDALVAHATKLHRAEQSYAVIAEALNREGWRPARRRDTFNGSMVHHLLSKTGLVTLKYRRRYAAQ